MGLEFTLSQEDTERLGPFRTAALRGALARFAKAFDAELDSMIDPAGFFTATCEPGAQVARKIARDLVDYSIYGHIPAPVVCQSPETEHESLRHYSMFGHLPMRGSDEMVKMISRLGREPSCIVGLECVEDPRLEMMNILAIDPGSDKFAAARLAFKRSGDQEQVIDSLTLMDQFALQEQTPVAEAEVGQFMPKKRNSQRVGKGERKRNKRNRWS